MLSNIILLRQSCLQTYHNTSRTIMTTTIASGGPISQTIERKLIEAFTPAHLEVRNESHMHNV